jgi:FkbM family methyltransferase
MADHIYDFGMNNGDDVEYYLAKGFKVVAVEADPKLCELSARRFSGSLADGRLVILNVALAGESSPAPKTFYIHRTNPVLSRLTVPDPGTIADYDVIRIPQRRASEIVREHGSPHYIKIDVEGVDDVVLADLFEAEIFPDFISAEIHSIYPFALFLSHGYRSFNLVDAPRVGEIYGNAMIATPRGMVPYSFKRHSAGPFGEDIVSRWWDGDSFVYVLASERLGWKDVHASRVIEPGPPGAVPIKLSLREHLRDLMPSAVRSVRARLVKLGSRT